MAEAGVDATHPLRDTSLSRRVRTLVRFCFLMAANRSAALHSFSGTHRFLGGPSRWTSWLANMRRCLFYRKSCFRHNFKAIANRGVNTQGGMIRFCPEYSIKSTLRLAVSPNSPLVIHPIIYLVDSLLAKPTYIHKQFYAYHYKLLKHAEFFLYHQATYLQLCQNKTLLKVGLFLCQSLQWV